MTRLELDNNRCEELIQRGAAGDVAACRELVDYLWPAWLELVRASRGIQLLPNAEDGIHEVVAILTEKLSGPDARGFQLYLPWRQRNPDKAFEDWLGITTQNTIRDYLREHVGAQPRSSSEPSIKQLLGEFTAASPVPAASVGRPPVTVTQTTRELLEFARTRLPPRAFSVFETWLAGGNLTGANSAGANLDNAAAETQLSATEVRSLLRSALAILRRHFAGKVR